jgi:hypothetical protein
LNLKESIFELLRNSVTEGVVVHSQYTHYDHNTLQKRETLNQTFLVLGSNLGVTYGGWTPGTVSLRLTIGMSSLYNNTGTGTGSSREVLVSVLTFSYVVFSFINVSP